MGECKTCNDERVLFYHSEVCMCPDCSDDFKLSNYIVAIRANSKQLEQQLKENQEKLKIAIDTLEFYAYPKQEDGDRAYIFEYEARQALKKIGEKNV